MIYSLDAKRDFQSVVKGANFMTPNVTGFYYCGDYAVELSHGTGFHGERIYGVTVVSGDHQDYDKSQMFHSLAEARAYMRGL